MSLVLSNISFKIEDKYILQDFSLNFPQNSVTLLSAPSGYGKTTLLRLIAGLECVSSGKISFNQELWSSPNVMLPPWKREIDMLFQNEALWPNLKIAEQINWIRQHRKAKSYKFLIDDILNKLGIKELTQRYPNSLSGGESKRCQLARALASEPQIILLDEPLSAQDKKTAQTTANFIIEWLLTTKTTAIIVTHNTDYFTNISTKQIDMTNI